MALAALAPGCAGVTDPHSREATSIAFSFWFMLVLALGVFVLVVAVLGAALFRARRASRANRDESSFDRRLVIAGGVVLPVGVMLVLMLMSVTVARRITEGAGEDTLRIDVVGRQWWWELNYHSPDFTTANELHIPVGRRVEITLRSNDVIHSFWVPQLAGKTDVIPGRPNTIVLEADNPGTYEGKCAEFCGLQHANMRFLVVADEPPDFAEWQRNEQQDADTLTEASAAQLRAGQQAFLTSACAACHTIRGTAASGTVGPDLTHVASRQRIASGVLPNNRGNLAGWILDPQSAKPGTQMPPAQIDSSAFQALLQYLESLY